MAVTLLAMFRRPDGGEEALQLFLRRYRSEHLPLISAVPGLRAMKVERVTQNVTPGDDLVLANHMTFDDRAALDAGLASEPMRQAGRNLREIAPGMLTLVVLEEEPPSDTPMTDPEAA